MFCAISGQVPTEPVVSKTTGHLYEKRLIHKALEDDGKCPVTGEELSVDDLLELKSSTVVKPRNLTATSIPGMLAMFQNEWDALMLETFTLKKHLGTVRQQLTQALYQHDAACRVIARLQRERDQAHAEVQSVRASAAGGAAAAAAGAAPPPQAPESMDVDEEGGVPRQALEAMRAHSAQLSAARKDRKKRKPKTLAKKGDIAKFAEASSHEPHSPGTVTCIAVSAANEDVVLTGGGDKTAKVFDRTTGQVTATLRGHSKRITSVAIHPTADMLFTASSDKTASFWVPGSDGYDRAHIVKDHSKMVTSLGLFPSGDYAVTASTDGTCCYHDVAQRTRIAALSDPTGSGFECVAVHPDGLLLGLGTSAGQVQIWDSRTIAKPACVFDGDAQGHEGKVLAAAFSENGYYLATGGADAAVKIWDLRKTGPNDQSMAKEERLQGPVSSLCFDFTGAYLAAAAGSSVNVMHVKSWKKLVELTPHAKNITGVYLSRDAQKMVTSSMDHALKFHAISA